MNRRLVERLSPLSLFKFEEIEIPLLSPPPPSLVPPILPSCLVSPETILSPIALLGIAFCVLLLSFCPGLASVVPDFPLGESLLSRLMLMRLNAEGGDFDVIAQSCLFDFDEEDGGASSATRRTRKLC